VKVVVIGAGVCGLATALALARSDHEVTVLERDAPPAPADPSAATQWERPGIPHFLQPHAFLARGVKELRDHAPDVYASLLEAGAEELRLFEKIPDDQPQPRDDELVFLGCRRPLIEWVLRKHVAAEKNVSLRSAVPALGVAWDETGSAIPRAGGVMTPAGRVDADLVVDGMGRSSPVGDWIVDGGGLAPDGESDDCGIVYYSRYFRFRPGHRRPEGPWLIGPRAELGYLETGTFWGDNDTFALVQQIRADDRALRVLRRPDAYMASLRQQPAFGALIDEDVSEPITPVLPMGQLRNTSRRFVSDGRPVASGLIVLGDARCHTNPRYAWGLSLALYQGFLLADLLRHHGRDVDAVSLAFEEAVAPWTAGAFATASATDNERKRYWGGEPIDPTSPAEALQLFLLLFFPAAGMRDPAVFRAAVRRLMLLDDPRSVEGDEALVARGSAIVRELFGSNGPAQGPTRDELIGVLTSLTGRA
jgi:2-polyprenyl-6-methoxyphenol hydroxylase-like FAD-dependent oxidoreductase